MPTRPWTRRVASVEVLPHLGWWVHVLIKGHAYPARLGSQDRVNFIVEFMGFGLWKEVYLDCCCHGLEVPGVLEKPLRSVLGVGPESGSEPGAASARPQLQPRRRDRSSCEELEHDAKDALRDMEWKRGGGKAAPQHTNQDGFLSLFLFLFYFPSFPSSSRVFRECVSGLYGPVESSRCCRVDYEPFILDVREALQAWVLNTNLEKRTTELIYRALASPSTPHSSAERPTTIGGVFSGWKLSE